MKILLLKEAKNHEDSKLIKNLATESCKHFNEVRGVKVGIADGSCCAAILLKNGIYRFGNSQAFDKDSDAPEKCACHAEQCALYVAKKESYYPHLFVELIPCNGAYKGHNCQEWIKENVILETGENEFYVWYLFTNPMDMKKFHKLKLDEQLKYIDNLFK